MNAQHISTTEAAKRASLPPEASESWHIIVLTMFIGATALSSSLYWAISGADVGSLLKWGSMAFGGILLLQAGLIMRITYADRTKLRDRPEFKEPWLAVIAMTFLGAVVFNAGSGWAHSAYGFALSVPAALAGLGATGSKSGWE